MSLTGRSDKEYTKMLALQMNLEEYVPNYQNYFVVPIRQCEPAPLSDADLQGINATCGGGAPRAPLRAFQHEINNKLSNYRIINMPYGGVPLSDVTRLPDSMWSLSHVFGGLCNLLESGIVPLNNAGILHFDIKDDNIVYDGDLVRLIDWDRMQLVDDIGIDDKSTLSNTVTLLGQPVAYALHSDKFKTQLKTHADLNNEDLAEQVLASVVRSHAWYEDNLARAFNVAVDKDFLKAQIMAMLNKFRSRGRNNKWEWDWPGYRNLLRHNFDVYGWLIVLLTCFVNAETMFAPADVRALRRENSSCVAELKRVFQLYLYGPNSLAEPYDIAAILHDVRAVATDVFSHAASATDADVFSVEAMPSTPPPPPRLQRLRPLQLQQRIPQQPLSSIPPLSSSVAATPLQRLQLLQPSAFTSPPPKKQRTSPPPPR
jgi:hypothetical protein